jgi:hypothetical protein
MPYWKLGMPQEPEKNQWGGVSRKIVNAEGEVLVEIEYYHDPIVDKPRAAVKFIERLTKIPQAVKNGEIKTFCLETVSSSMLTTRKMYQYDLESEAKDPRKWYGGSVDVLEEILMIQLPALPCNVCIGLHVSKTKVEAEGSMVRAPLLPGRLMDSFSSQWPEIYRCHIEKREGGEKTGLLQTQGDARWEAASQIDAPDDCEGHYENLWSSWDKAMKKQKKAHANHQAGKEAKGDEDDE